MKYKLYDRRTTNYFEGTFEIARDFSSITLNQKEFLKLNELNNVYGDRYILESERFSTRDCLERKFINKNRKENELSK